ncbi:MAG: hypothetical protein K0Q72_121 [Armatimonadetes bacterium]|jgi:hypothetical protein|nr:hypothetical protein [Armatimonadota bacterium]
MGSNRFIAVGHNGLRLVSADGLKWEHAQTGREGETFSLLCFGGGRCLAVGRFGGANLFSVTADGVTWKTTTRDAFYSKYLLGVHYAGGMFFGFGGDPGAVGASRPFVMTSKDGENWSDMREIAGKNVLRRVAWGKDRFVGVGDRGRRATSADGFAWEDVPDVKAVDTLVDVAFGNGVFVGVGLHGLRMTSPDGVTWSQRLAGEEGEHLNSILWTGDRFAAVGLGATYFSPNGTTWERRPNRNAPLTAVHGAGTFVGAAWKGRLLRSPDAVNWEQAYKAELHVEAVGYGMLDG